MTDSTPEKNGLGLARGTRIGKYEVVEMLGAGGQSVVYRCHDPLLDRDVAAKQISAHLAGNAEFLDHFRQEARTLAKIGADQPGIVTIHDLVEDENGLFIVMEFVEGITLEALLHSPQTPLAPKPAVQLLWRLAGAMSSVHQAGIVHRDLKPSNVIVSEGLRPKITDFGVASSVSGQTSMVMGTTKYMAPELFEGKGTGDGRSDMYSLGLIMYELLLGREKFNEIFADIVRDPRTAPVRWMKWHGNMGVQAPALHLVNPAIPAPLSDIVARMLAKDPALRYPDMEAMGTALREDLAGVDLPDSPQVLDPTRVDPMLLDAELIEEVEEAFPAGPSRQQLEDAPTMPLPRRSLSRNQRVGLIAGAVLLLIGVGVTLGVVRHNAAQDRKREAEGLYARARDDYDDLKYAEARDGFRNVAGKYPETPLGKKSRVFEALASARLAMGQREWVNCSQFEEKAQEALAAIEQEGNEELEDWVAQRKRDITELGQRRRAYTEYYDHIKEILAQADAGQYQQAATLLTNLRGRGVPPEREAEVDAIERDIHSRWIHFEIDTLMTDASEAIKLRDLHSARVRLDELTTLLTSERVRKYISETESREWRQWVSDQRVVLGNISTIQSLEEIIRLARERDNKQAELDALIELLELLPPGEDTDQVEARILELRIIITYENAQKLERQGNYFEAEQEYARVLQLSGGTHQGAKLALERLKANAEISDLWDDANTLFSAEDWAAAQVIYEVILEKSSGDNRAASRIQQCKFNLLVDEGDALLADGDLDAAKDVYDSAAEIAREADQMNDIDRRQEEVARLQRLRDAEFLILELIGDREWSEAGDAIDAAMPDCSTREETARMDELRDELGYEKHLFLGKQEMAAGKYRGAQVWLERALEYKETDELNALLEEVADKILEEDSGEES